ncbi:uncharacterized protein B0H18DRAFT_160144 [Fomitopsis serialis]|uniref:uncharacterized protein n=1 Tax=Fomitopsis serialis TaxID=139415 RepID=UPI0020082A09|nr:uncharacterized protein B0H18DRAFT_160144 [Neoantrodia serialis]KAH9930051.1 hypothetical protein B0H18DRAFT_160144 [Neoantrodia serialis]
MSIRSLPVAVAASVIFKIPYTKERLMATNFMSESRFEGTKPYQWHLSGTPYIFLCRNLAGTALLHPATSHVAFLAYLHPAKMKTSRKHKTKKSKQTHTHTGSDGAQPPPPQPRELPPELWSLVFANVDDCDTLLSSSLICRVAHREADPYLYRVIVLKRWRTRHILAIHSALQASVRRARMVHALEIHSAKSRVKKRAVAALVDIFRIVPNLKGLALTLFDDTNSTRLLPVLEQLGALCPFRLRVLDTNAPFTPEIVKLFAQQPDITFLQWNSVSGTEPVPRIPATALNHLKYLSCETGYHPFARSARGITHLAVGMLPQREIDEILYLLGDQLISFKMAESRIGEDEETIPAVAFRRGLPKCLKYLEVRDVIGFHFGRRVPTLTSMDVYDTRPFLRPGLTLETFVWEATWMRPFPLLQEEIQQFAEDVAVACRSLRRFIFYGEMNEPMMYELREGKVMDRVRLPSYPDDEWTRVA